ncbi:MAG: hypothetical protein J7L11_01210 [Thermoprotei archaeon]|nr:hypothetical protein [Thermoprotei archaeon]
MIFGPKVKVDLDIDKESYFPGDEIKARIQVDTNKRFSFNELRLELVCESFMKWEVKREFSLYSRSVTEEEEDLEEMVSESFIFRLVELKRFIMGKGEVTDSGLFIETSIEVPEDAPPTYKSGMINTRWFLKAVIGRRMRRDIVRKLERRRS